MQSGLKALGGSRLVTKNQHPPTPRNLCAGDSRTVWDTRASARTQKAPGHNRICGAQPLARGPLQ